MIETSSLEARRLPPGETVWARIPVSKPRHRKSIVKLNRWRGSLP